MDNQLLTELKQYCFALYWGQKVIQDVDNAGNVKLYPVERSNMYRFDESTLQLRSLSSITDQEAIEINEFNGNNPAIWAFKNKDYWIKELEFRLRENILDYQFYQYLQQQCFALPVYFKGVQYSVEQLTEYGIYQITELKQELI